MQVRYLCDPKPGKRRRDAVLEMVKAPAIKAVFPTLSIGTELIAVRKPC